MRINDVELQDNPDVGGRDDTLGIGKRVFKKKPLLRSLLEMSNRGLLSLFKRKQGTNHYTGGLIPKDFQKLRK